MRNVPIPGAVSDVGKNQGFVGISVLYTTEEVDGKHIPVWKVAYEPTKKEVRQLIEGGRVVLTVIGTPPISAHRLDVSST